MLINVLAAVADKSREVSLGEAALYALLGFCIVFAGIAFLILVVWLVGKIMSGGKSVSKPSAKKQQETATVPIKETPQSDSEEISEETIAIITAALMAYYEQNNPKCAFTVKRIKRI